MDFSQKTKNGAAKGSSNHPSEYSSNRKENDISKRYLYLHVYCSTTHTAKIWNQPTCPSTNE